MIFPGPDSAIFYLDPAAGLDSSNRWIDSSKYQLNVTPVGYAAPNYGLSLGPSGAPRITFDGAAQYGTIAAPANARFFAAAQTNQATVAVVARHNSPASGDRIFSSTNGALTRGMDISMIPGGSANQMECRGYSAAGAICLIPRDGDDTPYLSRTRVTILAGRGADALALRWIDGVGRTAAYPVAASADPVAYDAAVVPTVGRHSAGAFYFDGDLYFLGIWPLVFTDSEARAFSAYWMDRT